MQFLTSSFVSLFLIAAMAQNAKADWTAPAVADNGDIFTYSPDINNNETVLGLYADPKQNCSVYVSMVGETDIDDDDVEWENPDIFMQMRIDRNPIKETDKAFGRHEIKSSKKGLLRISAWANDAFLSEFVTGKKLIIRLRKEDGEFTDSVRYSLKGSSRALERVLDQCSRVRNKSNDEWDSSSDDSEWAL